MKTIHSEIKIEASPSRVWKILTSFHEYEQWNPFITSIKGIVATGNRITVKIQPINSSSMTFKPTVLSYVQNKEISWQGKLFIKGLFDGEHTFRLIDNNDGTTTFIQSETFRGILVPLFSKMIENNTLQGFHLMNQKLKDIATNSI